MEARILNKRTRTQGSDIDVQVIVSQNVHNTLTSILQVLNIGTVVVPSKSYCVEFTILSQEIEIYSGPSGNLTNAAQSILDNDKMINDWSNERLNSYMLDKTSLVASLTGQERVDAKITLAEQYNLSTVCYKAKHAIH